MVGSIIIPLLSVIKIIYTWLFIKYFNQTLKFNFYVLNKKFIEFKSTDDLISIDKILRYMMYIYFIFIRLTLYSHMILVNITLETSRILTNKFNIYSSKLKC